MNNSKGFTLIEIMAVIVMIGILSAVAIKQHVIVENSAELQALNLGVKELNIREMHTWMNTQLGDEYSNDSSVFLTCDYNLGPDYVWEFRMKDGGILRFRSLKMNLIRTPSMNARWAEWTMGG